MAVNNSVDNNTQEKETKRVRGGERERERERM